MIVKILLIAVEDIFMMRIACHSLLRMSQCCEISSKTHAKDHQSSFYLLYNPHYGPSGNPLDMNLMLAACCGGESC